MITKMHIGPQVSVVSTFQKFKLSSPYWSFLLLDPISTSVLVNLLGCVDGPVIKCISQSCYRLDPCSWVWVQLGLEAACMFVCVNGQWDQGWVSLLSSSSHHSSSRSQLMRLAQAC